MKEILTVGYEGENLESFISKLSASGVTVLVDVRMNAISRKKGFSKKAITAALAEAGIKYLHQRPFGNPTEFRKKAKTAKECLGMYRDHMEERWDEAMAEFLPQVQNEKPCLMCMEKLPLECHRSLVAQQIHKALPDTKVVNI